MLDQKKFSEKLFLGIFVEGQYLHVACLSSKKKRIKLIDAQIIKLAKALESVEVKEEVLSSVLSDDTEETVNLDLSEDTGAANWSLDEQEDAEEPDNSEILQQLLDKYPHRKNKLAITLAEPQIYYSYFGTDWGLEGKKLSQKFLEELTREKQDGEAIKPDALHLVRLKDGRLMGIVRENEVQFLNLLEYLRNKQHIKVPNITLVETAETSLVNLVNANYQFMEDEITVIVYLGNEFSRLIFLKGNQIYNISYIIGAGLDAENITHTIYSRILLEQDNLNLPNIQNIILTGEAYEVGLKGFLESKLPEEIKIDYIKLNNLAVVGAEPIISRFAVAIGTAWRTLNENEEYHYNIDLLPMRIRESQKKFKLGIVGWLLLLLLPALTVFSTVKIAEQREVLSQLRTQEQFHQEELAHLQDIEMKLNTKRNQLKGYQKAFAVLDSMSAGIHVWNSFLHKLNSVTGKIKSIWITEMTPQSKNTVLLKGYSVYRSRIPRLSNAIGGGALKKVEVQEIRDRTVYYFEMDANLPSGEQGG